MAFQKLSFVLCILAICAVDNVSCGSETLAPSPAVDCTNLILNLADCLPYVSSGSTTSKPEANCCSGLKTVLKTDAKCLCEGLKSSSQFGVVLNITKAKTLPSACHMQASSVTNCGFSDNASVAAPALSPSAAAGPAGNTMGTTDQAPAPSPKSDSAAISISVSSIVAALVVASFSSF